MTLKGGGFCFVFGAESPTGEIADGREADGSGAPLGDTIIRFIEKNQRTLIL